MLKTLVKGGGLSIDYNKALGNVTGLFGQVLGSKDDVQIPLPQSEKPRIKPEALTDVEIEQAIVPLFDFLDANLSTLNTYLSDTTKEMVMTRVWKEILNVIEGLLIPPLSDKSSDMKPLSDKEVDIVFKWLKVPATHYLAYLLLCILLTHYFSSCATISTLVERVLFRLRPCKTRNTVTFYQSDFITTGTRACYLRFIFWKSLMTSVFFHFRDALMEECVRMMQQSLRASPSVKKRAKSVYAQRNLGTIKNRKKEKQQEKEVSNGETILRILRMRYVMPPP